MEPKIADHKLKECNKAKKNEKVKRCKISHLAKLFFNIVYVWIETQ